MRISFIFAVASICLIVELAVCSSRTMALHLLVLAPSFVCARQVNINQKLDHGKRGFIRNSATRGNLFVKPPQQESFVLPPQKRSFL
eukprot:7689174-Pyramimonas_sp.AAC.1